MRAHWKPVSEPPTAVKSYLVTVQEPWGTRYVCEARYNPPVPDAEYEGGWFDLECVRLPVIAWDEMPEPFTGGDQ
jgi:hypothetical protein